MNLVINKKSLDNVLENVTEISHLLGDQRDLYNILALENIVTSDRLTLGDLYEYESHLKRVKLAFPKVLKKEKEKLYANDVDMILSDITKTIKQIEK